MQEDFEKQFRKALEEAPFEKPDEELKNAYKHILETKSIYELDCDFETYEAIINQKTNLFNASVLINAFTKTSPKDICPNLNIYFDLLKKNKDRADLWNEQVAPIRKKLGNKLQTNAILQTPKTNKKVIPFNR